MKKDNTIHIINYMVIYTRKKKRNYEMINYKNNYKKHKVRQKGEYHCEAIACILKGLQKRKYFRTII